MKDIETILNDLRDKKEIREVFKEIGIVIDGNIDETDFTKYFMLTFKYADDDLKRRLMNAIGEDLTAPVRFLLLALIKVNEEDVLHNELTEVTTKETK